jgi:hypothetical protein
LAGLDFFGTPGSIDQISDPDQAFLTAEQRTQRIPFYFALFVFFVVQMFCAF